MLDTLRQIKAWARTRLALPGRLAAFRRHERIPAITYARWIRTIEAPLLQDARLRERAAQFGYRPRFSIVMPVYNTQAEHLRKAIASTLAQAYTDWELCICDDASSDPQVGRILARAAESDPRIHVHTNKTNEGISEASNRAIALARGDFIGFLDHDDELAPHALLEAAALLQQHPEADLIYSDEDKLDHSGRRVDPFFKPDWSPEYMMSCKYVCHFTVIRTSVLKCIGGFRRGFEGSQDYDLVLRVSESTEKIFHIPHILYHWRKSRGSTAASAFSKDYASERGLKSLAEHLDRRGISASVEPALYPNRYRVRPLTNDPLVTIIIPTKDRVDLLRNCIESIQSKTDTQRYEIIILDAGSRKQETANYIKSFPRVIEYAEPFNFSKLNNLAAAQSEGEYLLFLNNDTEVISKGWLQAMLECMQLPGVAIVGAKLDYPNNTIQHAGIVLGIAGTAGHSHRGFSRSSRGYFDSLVCIRNYSAVTAACMMVRRTVFDEIGGFDEQLAVAYGDVDFCLRARERGYRVAWTPYAELYHHESASRGFAINQREVALFQQRWGQLFGKDPYYNPQLTMQREDYSLDV